MAAELHKKPCSVLRCVINQFLNICSHHIGNTYYVYIHLLEIPLEVAGDDLITQLLLDWEARCDTNNTGKRLRVNSRAFIKHAESTHWTCDHQSWASLYRLVGLHFWSHCQGAGTWGSRTPPVVHVPLTENTLIKWMFTAINSKYRIHTAIVVLPLPLWPVLAQIRIKFWLSC